MKKGNKVIWVLGLLLVLVVLSFGYYCLTINQKLNDLKIYEDKENEDTQPVVEERIEYTLFNKEKTLSEICTIQTGLCIESLGNFNLGDKEYTFSIHYNMDDLFNNDYFVSDIKNDDLANYIVMGDKKIYLNDGISLLDKVVKIGNDYIAIGIDSISGGQYTIKIYNKDLVLEKEYNSVHLGIHSEDTSYFEVSNDSFTRYKCNITLEEQMLEKYQITVNGNNFEEKLISSIPTICSAQT